MNHCPRCNSVLERKISGKIKYEHCSSCEGILIKEDQIKKVANSNNQSNKIGKTTKAPIIQSISVKCPTCAGDFIQIELNEIVIDKCMNCKLIWLDGGELEKYVEYLLSKKSSSGIDVASTIAEESISEIIGNILGEALGAIFDGF